MTLSITFCSTSMQSAGPKKTNATLYDGPNLAKTIKQQFKVHWPAPGTPGFKLPVFDLYREPRERNPLPVQGFWMVAYFSDMRARHMAFKKKFPDRPETHGIPYEGIENLRPETKKLVEIFELGQPQE